MDLAVLLCLFFLNGVHLKPDDLLDAADNIYSLTTVSDPINKTRSRVEAKLSSSQGDSGVIQILLPNTYFPRYVCYPETFLQHLEAVKLAHVICKQLGHVTFRSRYKETTEGKRPGVLSTSAQCTGLEEKVSQCSWKSIDTRRCKDVLSITCYSCYNKVRAERGSVYNPGYPQTFLYALTCEWTIEIPKELGIELTFEEFALPRSERHECESYIELTYGNQNSLANKRLCPADRPDVLKIPFKSVRVRFSSGVFRPKYNRQQTHYGFNILFRAAFIETPSPSNQQIKVILIATIFLAFFLMFMCCYCCRRGDSGANVANLPVFPLQPNAPSQHELQAAFEFQRGAMHVPQSEQKQKSDNSSTDSYVARWRSQSELPVTSALAPLGPERRMISIATTPRSVFPESRRKWSEESARRMKQLRTKLIARFPSTTSNNRSDISVFFSTSDRSSYSKLSCEEDSPLEKVASKEKKSLSKVATSSTDVPSIVVEFVE